MTKIVFALFSLTLLLVSIQCYADGGFIPSRKEIRERIAKLKLVDLSSPIYTITEASNVYIAPSFGLKESDKIESLPGQPDGSGFDQYSGYVTVGPDTGRALFYYFVESPHNSPSKPLVLWLNGGPGCSSLGGGAMTELGPFRVHSDGKTLYLNEYAWNNEANIIFLESPAGVGFSYSNSTSDYNFSGDSRTAHDSYTFLVNWLERFPEYKNRDFYIAGESYAGHYVPELAQTILLNNKFNNLTIINLKGIAIGNAYIDYEDNFRGSVDYYWTHALISDELHASTLSNCNFSSPASTSSACNDYLDQINDLVTNIYDYDIYAPLCNSGSESFSISQFDPCSGNYVTSYLNNPQVQKALHANVTALPYPWGACRKKINHLWKDEPLTTLPIIADLMANGLRIWIYSGDTDPEVPVTSTRYSLSKMDLAIKTAWYPWYTQGEVGGFAIGYENLTFVTIRGSGHFVPSYQPGRALALFSSFLKGNLPNPDEKKP